MSSGHSTRANPTLAAGGPGYLGAHLPVEEPPFLRRATCMTRRTVVSVFKPVPYVKVCAVRNTEPPRRGAEQTREYGSGCGI